MTVQDLQTRHMWHFFCECWLSSERGDGMTKKTFNAAKVNEVASFRLESLYTAENKLLITSLKLSDYLFSVLSQEHFPDQDIDWFQRRTHLGVHRGSSLTQPVHTCPEGFLLHVPSALYHGHQHRLLEHPSGSKLNSTLFNW